MNESNNQKLQHFEQLLRKSTMEKAPRVDAVPQVMLRISSLSITSRVKTPILDKTMLSICGMSVTLAIIMVMLTLDQLWILNDPLTGLFEPMGIALR